MKKNIQGLSIVLFVGLMAMFLMAVAAPDHSSQVTEQADQPTRTLYISGHGEVSVQPDVVVVRLGVQSDAEQAADALAQNNQQMDALIRVLKQGGVAANDIQTQRVDLYPRYQETGRDNQAQKLVGYTVTNIVEARLRGVDGVGEVLDAAVSMGGNRIESIRFEVSDTTEALEAARQAAWNNARDKAEQLAALSGVTLGDVLSLSESSVGPRPYMEQPLMADAALSVPIESGTQTIAVDLQVTWLLTNGD